jgi:hypothetical protein
MTINSHDQKHHLDSQIGLKSSKSRTGIEEAQMPLKVMIGRRKMQSNRKDTQISEYQSFIISVDSLNRKGKKNIFQFVFYLISCMCSCDMICLFVRFF